MMSTGSPLREASSMGSSPLAWRRCILAPSTSFFCLARSAACRSCFLRPSRKASCCWAVGTGASVGAALPLARQEAGCGGSTYLWWMCLWRQLWLLWWSLTGVLLMGEPWAGLWEPEGCWAAEGQRGSQSFPSICNNSSSKRVRA